MAKLDWTKAKKERSDPETAGQSRFLAYRADKYLAAVDKKKPTKPKRFRKTI